MRLFRRQNVNGTWTWWAQYSARHPRTGRTVTRRRSTKCSTKGAAELVVARWERERADPVYAAANAATFGKEVGLFLASCKSAVARDRMAPGTLSMYRQKAGILVYFLGEDLRLADIDAGTFAAYLERRREHGLRDVDGERIRDITESTLYKEWVTFAGILRQAWRAQRFGRDPRSLKPAHFGPEYTPKETHLTWAQARKLLAALTPTRRAPVAFAMMTGARRKEVFAAQPEDMKAGTVLLRGSKTATSWRTIPIPSVMRTAFGKHVGKPPFRPWGNSRRELAAACKRVGAPAVTWNDLRRTFASLLVQAHVAPHVVARLLGHTTTAMVDRVYGRTSSDSLGDMLEKQLRKPARKPKQR